MARGRPTKSVIRQNIVEILYVMGEGYAYDIHRVYTQIFPKTTLRSIYYHLKKGSSIGEFSVKSIKKEKGDYSWGPEAEKIYYKLGPRATPKLNPRVREFFAKS